MSREAGAVQQVELPLYDVGSMRGPRNKVEVGGDLSGPTCGLLRSDATPGGQMC